MKPPLEPAGQMALLKYSQLPQQRDHVFRPNNYWLSLHHRAAPVSHQQALKLTYFFNVACHWSSKTCSVVVVKLNHCLLPSSDPWRHWKFLCGLLEIISVILLNDLYTITEIIPLTFLKLSLWPFRNYLCDITKWSLYHYRNNSSDFSKIISMTFQKLSLWYY